MAKESMFKLARMILNDQCPPDNTMYLCRMGECNDDCRCIECWDNYLLWAVNGYKDRDKPYQYDKYREAIESFGFVGFGDYGNCVEED